MNHHQLHKSLVFIQRRWWCIYGGIEWGFSIMISFWKSKVNSNKLCSQLGQVKVALEKHQELVNRKCIIFHQDTTRPCVWWPGKNFYSLAGSSDSSAIFTRYCTFGIPFIWPLQNSLNGRKFNSLEYCKRHLEQFFAQKGKFWKDEIMKLLKEVIRQCNKMVNTLFIKVLLKMKKTCLIFT